MYTPEALYHIQYWMPTRRDFHGASFHIILFPAIKDIVSSSGMDQEKVDYWIDNMWQSILHGHGYTEDCFSKHDIQVSWGEWGCEHITVPGNACGLDIDREGLGRPPGGAILQPHNVDVLVQASMLLSVFLGLTDYLVSSQIEKMFDTRR